MKEKIENFLRTYIIPAGATILAYLYYQQYQCQNAWWWLVLIGTILVVHYFFYFKKARKGLTKIALPVIQKQKTERRTYHG